MAEVVQLFPVIVTARDCEGCGGTHYEPGMLCPTCRTRKPAPVPAVVARSVAEVIADLEQLNKERYPLSDLMIGALKNARAVYDAVAPRLQDATGEIHFVDGEFWAVPADDHSVRMGPFGSAEFADDALVERATKKAAGEDSDCG